MNLLFFYDLDIWQKGLNKELSLCDFLFGAVKITKNNALDEYECKSFGIGFDACSAFSLLGGEFCQNIIAFGVENSSSIV